MADTDTKRGGGCLRSIGLAAIGVVALIILIAIFAPSSSKKSAGGTDTAEPPKVEMKVTARELADAYTANEVKAQSVYGDKPLAVTGRIESIALDFMNRPTISFDGGTLFSKPQASFSKDDAKAIADLNKGNKITVHCTEISEVVSTPMLSDCTL